MIKIFNSVLQLNGFKINEAEKTFKKILDVTDDHYPNFIEQKKREIVEFHLKNNLYYKNFVGTAAFNPWDSLPIMTKKAFQNPLADRLSNGYLPKNVYVNKTSGSSGDPFIFAIDKPCHALTWASTIYRFGWYGIDFNTSLQARFYGIPLDFFGNTKERFKDLLSQRYRFSVFNLSDAVLEQMLKKFQSKKFDYINGYTSSIVLFAKFLQKKNIILKNVCPTLKVCMATSEMLFLEDKILLEQQFGIPVVNEYGASELGLIAFENPNGAWQVNAENIYLEILDPNNKPLPYGQAGRVVITSLYNKAHPIIRYDIGDIGILDEKSTIKKPILKQLIGRTNDVAILPSGKKSPGLTFYYVTKSIIEDDGNVKEFIVKQITINTFEIDYVATKALDANQIQKIETAIAKYLEPNLQFSYHKKDVLVRSASGKLKQFVSKI